MAGFFEQAKQALARRSKMKKIQRDLELATKEYENAGVKVVVHCDMTVASVAITDPAVLDPARVDRLQRTIVENTNKALHLAKDEAQERMKAATKDMGLGGMLG